MNSDADTPAISPEPSFKQATIAKAIATYAAATIATAAPCWRYVVLRYLHCSKFNSPGSGCKVNRNSWYNQAYLSRLQWFGNSNAESAAKLQRGYAIYLRSNGTRFRQAILHMSPGCSVPTLGNLPAKLHWVKTPIKILLTGLFGGNS